MIPIEYLMKREAPITNKREIFCFVVGAFCFPMRRRGSMKLKKFTFDRNRRGIWLREEELEGLKLIYRLDYLSLETLYNYVTSLGDYKPSYNSFRNRVRMKYEQWDLVNRHFYAFGQQGFGYLYLSLKKNGVHILKESGYLPPDTKERSSTLDDIHFNHQDHTLSVRDIVTNILIEERKRSASSDLTFEHFSPSQLPYHHPDNKEHILFAPDWIIKNGNRYVNLEIDTGSENHNVLKKKLLRYIKYANLYPDKKHVVIFSVLDDSFRTRSWYGDRVKRIISMKETFLNNIKELKECDNLKVYVVPYKSTKRVAYQLLKGSLHEMNKSSLLSQLRNSVSLNFEREGKYKLESVYESSHTDVDVEMVIKDNETGDQYHLLCLFVEEGSITDFQRILSTQTLLHPTIFNSQRHMLCVYGSKQELDLDVTMLEPHVSANIALESLMFGKEELMVASSVQGRERGTLSSWLKESAKVG